mmetsp:Transcript_27251/g.65259  ORF Transcript_27251/g.65259 Transcript_27251/m.65259 type:complete len:209 (-) Transcript_27251:1830-2456(-)
MLRQPGLCNAHRQRRRYYEWKATYVTVNVRNNIPLYFHLVSAYFFFFFLLFFFLLFFLPPDVLSPPAPPPASFELFASAVFSTGFSAVRSNSLISASPRSFAYSLPRPISTALILFPSTGLMGVCWIIVRSMSLSTKPFQPSCEFRYCGRKAPGGSDWLLNLNKFRHWRRIPCNGSLGVSSDLIALDTNFDFCKITRNVASWCSTHTA